MSLRYEVLGKPGWDNGLMVWINSGTKVYRLLFDCGENILRDINQHDIKSIDYLFLSHLHIDHIAGFDYFFRRNYDREKKPIHIYGPADTVELIHNRLRGFKWNLVKDVPGLWYVTEMDDKKSSTFLFKTSDGYSVKIPVENKSFKNIIVDTPDFSVHVTFLNHIIPSAAYFVKEKPSLKINKEALLKTGVSPGPWLEKVRSLSGNSTEEIFIDDKSYKLKALKEKLLERKEGESIGYLTDFIYGEDTSNKIKKIFKNCNVMICESQYQSSENKFAKRNYHLTAKQAARLAKAANAKKLFLFHISDRYKIKQYSSLLNEAREIFKDTYLPNEWKIRF
jgi:ribonuclease Z